MLKRARSFRPSPALVISVIALCVAVGGSTFAVAALSSPEKKQVKKIAKGQVNSLASGLTVGKAGDADKLGGTSPSGFQRFCSAGAIKATLVFNTTGFTSATYVNQPGFNCFQPGNLSTSVAVKKISTGVYAVRFVGNTGANNSGSAVVSRVNSGGSASWQTVTNDVDAPGEIVFHVTNYDAAGNPQDNGHFSLLAF